MRGFSPGCVRATSSISVPPSVEATKAMRERGAIDQRGEIIFAVDGRAFLDVEAMHFFAVRPGLMRHQRRAEQTLGLALHVGDRFHHLDAAGLAAAAGVDLRLHHPHRPAEIVGGFHRFVRRSSPECRAAPARRIRAARPSPGIRGCSWRSPRSVIPAGRVRRTRAGIHNYSPIRRDRSASAFLCWGYGLPARAAGAPRNDRHHLPRLGAIFLQASTRPSTACTDFSNMPRSAPLSSISTTRSTPLLPMTTGTPT